MKLRFQIVIVTILTVLVGLIEYARNSKDDPFPPTLPAGNYAKLTAPANNANPPTPDGYPVNTGSVEDMWPPETSEPTTTESGRAESVRWGGANARFSYYDGPEILVEADTIQLWGHFNDGVIMFTRFAVNSDKLVEPDLVTFQFIRDTPPDRKLDGRQLSIMAGTKTVFSKPLDVKASSGAMGARTEVMEAAVPYRAFKQAVESGNFVIRLGTSLARLNSAQRGKLQSMVRLVNRGVRFSREIMVEPTLANPPASTYR